MDPNLRRLCFALRRLNAKAVYRLPGPSSFGVGFLHPVVSFSKKAQLSMHLYILYNTPDAYTIHIKTWDIAIGTVATQVLTDRYNTHQMQHLSKLTVITRHALYLYLVARIKLYSESGSNFFNFRCTTAP